MTKGEQELAELHKSAKEGNILGLVLGLAGVTFLAVTIYGTFMSVKVNKLNIKKLNSEGFK